MFTDVSEENNASIFSVEEKIETASLQNIDKHLPDYTTQHVKNCILQRYSSENLIYNILKYLKIPMSENRNKIHA
jgi:hypothetical protein